MNRKRPPKHISKSTIYTNLSRETYEAEKRRLQIELLDLQNHVIENKLRVAIVFEGRDAAGKGSTIKRFTENLMTHHFNVVELGIPTKSESKYWFKRYEKHLPGEGEITFFDRSWYNRALIEPTMGYCKEQQYRYFMNKVLRWEHDLIDNGLLLIKFYLSVNKNTQLTRFEDRISDPLTFWKFSQNDKNVRKEWERFTGFKDQMLKKTSSVKSPWVVVGANNKKETRLTCLLYAINQLLPNNKFKPLKIDKVRKRNNYSTVINGVKFDDLSVKQYETIKHIINQTKPSK